MSRELSFLACTACGRSTYGVVAGNLSIVCEVITIWGLACAQCGAEIREIGSQCKACGHAKSKQVIVREDPGCGARVYVCRRCGLRTARADKGKIVCKTCGIVRDRTKEDQIAEGMTFAEYVKKLGQRVIELPEAPRAQDPSVPPPHAIRALPIGPSEPQRYKPPQKRQQHRRKKP